ncbi:hypothetical protein PRZ48_010158 [Zasmidium cellare]|uniref:Uncharacterized protein n=1 Tax=Zasmidium cellare TaxID=395010 RepID=A0ABR0EDS6_ZASCE|nr:hypothetical protein PRZ48_010158 [Zasmidium cellare]
MAKQIDIASLEAQLTEAFVDLDFALSESRHKAFFNLCVQYCQLENRRVIQRRKQHNLFLTPQDILEYAVVTFIQNYGDRLWPFDSAARSHINTTFTWNGNRINPQLGFFADVDQNCPNFGNNDRSLWQEKIRSPLGQKVKRYFQCLDRVPANLFPNLGEPTMESMEGWLRRVVDTLLL